MNQPLATKYRIAIARPHSSVIYLFARGSAALSRNETYLDFGDLNADVKQLAVGLEVGVVPAGDLVLAAEAEPDVVKLFFRRL